MTYIYERNPDTGEIFRRKFGDYDSPRECINPEVIQLANKHDRDDRWLEFLVKDNPNNFDLGEKVRQIVNNKTEDMDMISLYDYLGHAAGPELGKKVAGAAARAGVKFQMREVNHRGWNGPIMLYPRDFLDNFFGGGLGEGKGPGKQLLKG